MSKALKNTLAGVALAGLLFVGAGSAKAATIAELQALIADLTAQLSALSGGSSSCSYNHTMTLRVGMSGSQVMALQTALGISADGKFGPQTFAKVKAFQASKGLMSDGVVGPMTGNALCAGSPSNPSNPNPSNPGLQGDNGSIEDINTLSQYSSEEVGDGEEDVTIAGVEIEVSNDGDIMLKSVKVVLDPSGNNAADSDNLDDYIDSVSIWLDGEEVGSADADDFSETDDDTYTRTISLDDAVIRAEDTERLLIAVNAANNLDTGDIDSDSWTVAIESIRYEDGDGVVTTESSQIPTDIDWDSAGDGIAISFVSFSDSADIDLKVSTNSDNPEAGIVVVSDSGSTDDVVLLVGDLELEGDSDVTIEDFPVTFMPTTSTFQSMVESIRLEIDGEEYSESVPSIAAGASASVTFDNLDFTLEAGEEVEFRVIAEISDRDDFSSASSSTITASVTSDSVENWLDAENEEGDNLGTGEKSGSASGEAQEFMESGISVELVSTDASKSASDTDNGDTATFEIKFKVTAIGSDVYVSSTASTAASSAPDNNRYTVDKSGTATTAGVSAAFVNNTDAELTSGGVFMIEDGESETFTMTIVRTINEANDDGLYRATLTSIEWDTDDGSALANTYSTNLDEFQTDYVSLD